MKNRITVAFLLCMMFLLCGCQSREKEVIWETWPEKEQEAANVSETENGGDRKNPEPGDGVSAADSRVSGSAYEADTQPETICVDICGAVANPGVYLLEDGARVYEAVELAGGLTEDADRSTVNQAERLTDGAKIRIYSTEEAETLSALENAVGKAEQDAADAGGLVNLNTADAACLCTLSGIGEARARDVIAYREAHGGFSSIEEIMQVNGIKEATFQKIKDKIVAE